MFINVDLTRFVRTEEEEAQLTLKLLDAHVFILPHGAAMHGSFGMFRIVFAVPREQLIEGCKRIVAVVRASFPDA
jgi:aspartate/methionine/tyrosine aminotransferase